MSERVSVSVAILVQAILVQWAGRGSSCVGLMAPSEVSEAKFAGLDEVFLAIARAPGRRALIDSMMKQASEEMAVVAMRGCVDQYDGEHPRLWQVEKLRQRCRIALRLGRKARVGKFQ